jgi:predicted nucleotidyltransferase
MSKKEQFPLYDIISGSRAYGTFREDSDYDYRMVYTLDPLDLIDPFHTEEVQTGISGDVDEVSFEFRKFMNLAAQSNPNVIEFLFVPDHCIRFMHIAFQKNILNNRQAFLSKEASVRFAGYMKGQLSRMELHQAWFKDPPTASPERSDYGVPEFLTNEQVVQMVSMPPEIGAVMLAEYGATMTRWQEFLNMKKRWQNYQRWLKERNPARAELERNFGYDTKHFSHLLRLGLEALDIATLKTIRIPHPEVQILKDARAGKFSPEEAAVLGAEMFEKIKVAFEHADLPDKADREVLTSLYLKTLKDMDF